MFLLKLIDAMFLIYTIMLLVRILASWIPEWRHTQPMLFLAYYTDPYLNFFRSIIPPLGMLDLSPIAAMFALSIIQWVIKVLLINILIR
jgi:YggT family protein